MTFGSFERSARSAKAPARPVRDTDGASMDEILASIRKIIAEDPIDASHFPRAPIAGVVKKAEVKLPVATVKPEKLPKSKRSDEDDILAELLEPAVAPANPPVRDVGEAGTEMIAAAASEVPHSPALAEVVVATESVEAATPPEAEVLAAESVLGALAAGLAAVAVADDEKEQQGVDLTVGTEALPINATADAMPAPSPAEAAAAAVAEVAAANLMTEPAAMVGTELPMVEPSVAIEVAVPDAVTLAISPVPTVDPVAVEVASPEALAATNPAVTTVPAAEGRRWRA